MHLYMEYTYKTCVYNFYWNICLLDYVSSRGKKTNFDFFFFVYSYTNGPKNGGKVIKTEIFLTNLFFQDLSLETNYRIIFVSWCHGKQLNFVNVPLFLSWRKYSTVSWRISAFSSFPLCGSRAAAGTSLRNSLRDAFIRSRRFFSIMPRRLFRDVCWHESPPGELHLK